MIPRPWLCLHHPAPVAVYQQVEGVVVGVAQQAPAQVLLPGGPVLPHQPGVGRTPAGTHSPEGFNIDRLSVGVECGWVSDLHVIDIYSDHEFF